MDEDEDEDEDEGVGVGVDVVKLALRDRSEGSMVSRRRSFERGVLVV
jgi:hypothetical protein